MRAPCASRERTPQERGDDHERTDRRAGAGRRRRHPGPAGAGQCPPEGERRPPGLVARRASADEREAGGRDRGEAVRAADDRRSRRRRRAERRARDGSALALRQAQRPAALETRDGAAPRHGGPHRRLRRRPDPVPHRAPRAAGGRGGERHRARGAAPLRRGRRARARGAERRPEDRSARAAPGRHRGRGRRDRRRRDRHRCARRRAAARRRRGDRPRLAHPRQRRPAGDRPRQPHPRRGVPPRRLRRARRAAGVRGGRPLPRRRRPRRLRPPAAAPARAADDPPQDHGQPRHRRAAAAAERAHAHPHPAGRSRPRPGLPRVGDADAVRREDRPAPARQGDARARHDAARVRRGVAAPLPGGDRTAVRDRARHRPHRLGQDEHALLGALDA